jgi:hypothetical protein
MKNAKNLVCSCITAGVMEDVGCGNSCVCVAPQHEGLLNL